MNREANEAERKKAIFESMSPRRQNQILKKGYDKWNPFELPKDPIDIRMDQGRRTTQTLIREFFQREGGEPRGNDYRRGAFELCLGIINQEEKYMGMFDFACWYRDLLERDREGLKPGE